MPHSGSVEIRRRIDDGTTHFHGLVRCGSWSACPVCAFQIATQRAQDISRIAEAHRATGGAAYLVTFTLPHDQSDRLEPLYEAVADSYRRVRSGARWYKTKASISYVGEIRAFEATVGPNGWHPHLHVLLFIERTLDAAELDELQRYYHERWSASVVRYGYRPPTIERGVTIVESKRDDYLAKMGLARELTMGASKDAQNGRVPFQVLADLGATGDLGDRDRWREWVLAMHGARQLTWSRGLRERYSTESEKTDAEIVGGDSEGGEELVAVIAGDVWCAMVRANPNLAWQLLDAAESGGATAAEAILATIANPALPP